MGCQLWHSDVSQKQVYSSFLGSKPDGVNRSPLHVLKLFKRTREEGKQFSRKDASGKVLHLVNTEAHAGPGSPFSPETHVNLCQMWMSTSRRGLQKSSLKKMNFKLEQAAWSSWTWTSFLLWQPRGSLKPQFLNSELHFILWPTWHRLESFSKKQPYLSVLKSRSTNVVCVVQLCLCKTSGADISILWTENHGCAFESNESQMRRCTKPTFHPSHFQSRSSPLAVTGAYPRYCQV